MKPSTPIIEEITRIRSIIEKSNIVNGTELPMLYLINDELFLTEIFQNNKVTCKSAYGFNPFCF